MKSAPHHKDLITIEPDGSVYADNTELLSQYTGQYQLLLGINDLLILNKKSGSSSNSRVLMAGEIISRLTIMEIINIIATTNWRGELYITDGTVERILAFDQGALKHAHGSPISDRLGEVMVRNGILSRNQLSMILANRASSSRRFGELCVEQGLIDQQKLFEQLRRQVEHIFYCTLLMSEGHYIFFLPDENETEPYPATVHIKVQALLMEGVQRMDEMTLFRNKIPNIQVCPKKNLDAPARQIDEIEKAVLHLCTGVNSIDEIAKELGLDDFLAIKAVYHLLQAGMVTLPNFTSIDPNIVKQLVDKFNEVLQDIFIAVATYGGLGETLQIVDLWISGSGYSSYFGNAIDDSGYINSDRIVDAMCQIELERPIDMLHQALHELAAFALFSATTQLPRDQEVVLARDVNIRLKSIRIE